MSYRSVLWLSICFSVLGVSAPVIAEEDQVVEEIVLLLPLTESPL